MDHHLQEKYRLDHTLPSSIVIGPFMVSVEATRQSLSSKRRGLANAVLDQFALRLRQQVDDVGRVCLSACGVCCVVCCGVLCGRVFERVRGCALRSCVCSP